MTATVRPVRRVFAGDGWTAAVALDDAYAPELLQTWSLPDDPEDAGAPARDDRAVSRST